MLQFIGGVVIGAIAATYAMALIANKQENAQERRIRELQTANRVLQEEHDSAQRLQQYWRARCLHETLGVDAVAPEYREAAKKCV